MATSQDSDPFHEAFGAPVIAARPMRFQDAWLDHMMTGKYARIGAGWFLGRMFYMFGDDLVRLDPCVDAWSFLLTPSRERWTVIGFNAYGCILLLDNEGERGTVSPVGMLDPLTVTFFTDPQLDIYSLLNVWLPERRLGRFLDTSVYQQFLETSNRLLDDDEILGIRAAVSFGGEMTLRNFSPSGIVDYYEATGPTYAKAYERFRSSQ